MHTQVQLNPAKLSILSIPREICWIFASPILQLLHQESLKANRFNMGFNLEFSEDDEAEENGTRQAIDEQFHIHANTSPNSPTTFGSEGKNPVSFMSSSGFLDQNDLPVDNSSKIEPTRNGSFDSDRETTSTSSSLDRDEDRSDYDDDNYFFHIAYTPVECTVICSSDKMNTLFQEPLKVCKQLMYENVKLIDQPFLSLLIDSDGSFDNSSRILELTKPLSDNNISLFFLSSHFGHIVLIPFELKKRVISILAKQSFEFSDFSNSYIVNNQVNEVAEEANMPQSTDGSKLEIGVFEQFKKASIKPEINEKVNLLLTGARSGEVTNTILKTAKNISSNNIPDYFSITRTSINELSLLLPKSSSKRSLMGFNSRNIVGSIQDVIIPITIDLYKLPLDSTGIVAGVASHIVNGIKASSSTIDSLEMNYLSMARSAIIMIPKENLALVSDILSIKY